MLRRVLGWIRSHQVFSGFGGAILVAVIGVIGWFGSGGDSLPQYVKGSVSVIEYDALLEMKELHAYIVLDSTERSELDGLVESAFVGIRQSIWPEVSPEVSPEPLTVELSIDGNLLRSTHSLDAFIMCQTEEFNPVVQGKEIHYDFEGVGSLGGNHTANLEEAFQMVTELAPLGQDIHDLEMMLRDPARLYAAQMLTITRTEGNGEQFRFNGYSSNMEGGNVTSLTFSPRGGAGPPVVLLVRPAAASGAPEGLAESVAAEFETLLKKRLIDEPLIRVSALTEEEIKEKRREWADSRWSRTKAQGIEQFSVDYIIDTTLILK